MSGTNLIFSVVSSADLGIDRYNLDERDFNHILLGHRDLRNFTIGIEDTVKNPTHVYSSSFDSNRYQFVSHNVTSAHGRPMNVIIEQEIKTGRVITASPRSSTNGVLIWDANIDLYGSYDSRSDILYFSSGPSRSAYASDDEDDARVWLRFFDDDDSPAGMTIFEASQADLSRRDSLVGRVADFLKIDKKLVDDRWRVLMKLP